MRPLRLSVAAERDLRIILAASEEHFGATVAGRYQHLVSAALRDLRSDAERIGVQVLDSGVRVYHLRHSRRQLPRRQSVARPRHVLAFRIVDGGIVLLRVLHDAMDLPSRLAEL